MTIFVAPQDGVDAFEPQVQALLAIIGHPEALVTDESTFLDFICMFQFPSLAEAQAELDRMLADADVSVNISVRSTLVQAIRQLIEDNPSWPGVSTH